MPPAGPAAFWSSAAPRRAAPRRGAWPGLVIDGRSVDHRLGERRPSICFRGEPEMTSSETKHDAEWIRSSTAGDSGQYVEMRRIGELIEVRDAKDGVVGPTLRFTPAEWDAWLDGAKKGEFDHLLPED
jgi:hypothetical protein